MCCNGMAVLLNICGETACSKTDDLHSYGHKDGKRKQARTKADTANECHEVVNPNKVVKKTVDLTESSKDEYFHEFITI